MVKSILKEIIIILLLLLAIVLALGVLFYDYIPSNKVVPSVETYTTSASVQSELAEQITEDETVLVTYEITSSDLNTYEKANQYTKGKVNPFSTYENEIEETEDETSPSTATPSSNTTNTNTGTSTSSNTTFYPETGTK